MSALPWSWETKTANFIKPGDEVLRLRPEAGGLFTVGHPCPLPCPDESFQIVLSRERPCDFAEVWRVLKPGGFFLMECVGSEDCRALAEFLVPGSRPAGTVNLENLLPRMKQAGFRIMYRDQARPLVTFPDVPALCRYIAGHPEKFPGFSPEACAGKLALLEKNERLYVEEHIFMLIGKKQ